MTIRRMAAHPWVSMGRAISITASSSAWAHGGIGAIATAGVVIASAVVEEEGMSPEVDTAAGEDMAVGGAHRQYVAVGIAVVASIL